MLNINLNINCYKLIKKHKQILSKIVLKTNNLVVKERVLIVDITKRFVNYYYVLVLLHRNFILENLIYLL